MAACSCDPSKPESLESRNCSLTKEALKQPETVEFFVLKDASPRKPNRWLVLPRVTAPGAHPLHDLPLDTRQRLWAFAVGVAEQKFGDDWGIAYNGYEVRTQCHLHIHVGRYVTAGEQRKFRFVKSPKDFPAPETTGVWIHPVPGGYHVHEGEQIAETVLVR
jgi:diadenosine tetraphosphate (Ap4A) HIT family hydrolase